MTTPFIRKALDFHLTLVGLENPELVELPRWAPPASSVVAAEFLHASCLAHLQMSLLISFL